MADEGFDDGAFEPGREGERGVDRRSFVKGSLQAAALGAVAASGWGLFRQAVPAPDFVVRTVRYLGAAVQEGSPAPRGLPIIPVRVDAKGLVEGVPDTEGENHLDWLRYCGHERTPGLIKGATDDNVFRYHLPEDKLLPLGARARDVYWYMDRLGDVVRADDLAARPFGTGAAVRWRSEGRLPEDLVTALVLRIDPTTVEGVGEAELARFMDVEHGIVAFSTFCTHLCCVPGWKEADYARQKGWWDHIYCACHGSHFDPARLRSYTFDLRLPIDADQGSRRQNL